MGRVAVAFLLSVCAIGLAPLAVAAPVADKKVLRSDTAMGTRITLTLWTDDEARAAEAAKLVFDEFRRIDRLMTTWLDDSDVSRINDAAGKSAVRVDPEVIAVLSKAQQVARASRGAFDVTVGAFSGLWKFDEDLDGSIPAAADVTARLASVDYRKLRINPKARTARLLRPGMRITLGGIAKGYALDRAVALLYQHDLVDFILQAGGDLFVSGKKGAQPWVVGIRDPRGDRSAVFAVAEVENRTFSTSGDYERSVIKDGKRYHHILDPKTGNPVTGTRSVTVMAKDAFTADAWSTALFVLGVDEGMKLVEKLAELDAVFVDADNRVHVSSGLRDRVRVLHPPTDGP